MSNEHDEKFSDARLFSFTDSVSALDAEIPFFYLFY